MGISINGGEGGRGRGGKRREEWGRGGRGKREGEEEKWGQGGEGKRREKGKRGRELEGMWAHIRVFMLRYWFHCSCLVGVSPSVMRKRPILRYVKRHGSLHYS